MPQFSIRHRFLEWPNPDIPATAVGVYAVWEGEKLIYCGMAGRQLDALVEAVESARSKKCGLAKRLADHASGRLGGDQFCVYVANKLVIPFLQPEQLAKFGTGELTLDCLTKAYVNERLEYQVAIVQSSSQARDLERLCRTGVTFGVKPLLNPK
jgi:hypothetical protein